MFGHVDPNLTALQLDVDVTVAGGSSLDSVGVICESDSKLAALDIDLLGSAALLSPLVPPLVPLDVVVITDV